MERFEYDNRKSLSNKKKHGVDFIEAQAIWDDENRVEIPARTEDETRFMTIGKVGKRVWSAVTTIRDGKVRIISVRRAWEEEVRLYESKEI